MIYFIVFMSMILSVPVAFAFKSYGPRAMVLAGVLNFVAYMAGLWLLGVFSLLA